MNWLKLNWFIIIIALAMLLVASSIAYYFIYYLPSQDTGKIKPDSINNEIVTPESLLQEQIEEVVPKQAAQQNKSQTTNLKIKSQLEFFETFFEDTLIDAYIACDVLATFTNVSHNNKDEEFINQAFPPAERDKYNEKCRSKFVEVLDGSSSLIAEPELVQLRTKITALVNVVRSLAPFALEGGYDATTIDLYSSQYKTLRTEIREEILRVKRVYSL